MTVPSDETRRKIDEPLLALYQERPRAIAAAIVGSEGPAHQHRAEVEAAGLTVRRVFRLIPALAVEGAVSDLMRLAEVQWVTSISLDRELHTMGPHPTGEVLP